MNLALALVLYVAFVLAPGLGVGEALGIWNSVSRSLSGRIAAAAGLGLASDSVIMFVRTSGLSLAGHTLLGIDLTTIYTVVAAGGALALVSVAIRRRFSFPTRPRWVDLGVALLMIATAVTVVAYLSVFPVFPESNSVDFVEHIQYANSLISGQIGSVPNGVLYFGVHYQIGSFTLMSGLDTLVASRYTMAVLTVLSVLPFFLCADTLFENERVGLAAALVYAVPGSIWFGLNFNSGLYPQFFGMLITLFAITLSARFVKGEGWRTLLVPLALTFVAGYLSHYSILTIIPGLIAIPILIHFKGQKITPLHWAPAAMMVAPLGLVLVRPDYFKLLSSLVSENPSPATQSVLGTTPLGSIFAAYPALYFVVLEITDDLAAAVMLLLAGALIVILLVRFSRVPSWALFPVLWLGTLLLITPFNAAAWRFSLVTLVPLTLLVGAGLVFVGNFLVGGGQSWRKVVAVLFVVATVAAVVNGSWGEGALLLPTTSPAPDTAHFQQEVFTAMQWLKQNTSSYAVYYAVTDWRFTYITYDYHRNTIYHFTSNESEAVSVAFSLRNDSRTCIGNSCSEGTAEYNATVYWRPVYVIVSRYVTESLPQNPSLYPWNTFAANANLTLVYDTPDVEVFHLTPIPACFITTIDPANIYRTCPLG